MESFLKNTLLETLGMEVLEARQDFVQIRMPVDERTRQPMGFLHGGASVALAESAASIGAYLNADAENQQIFGIEINANHIKSIREGYVTAHASPIHLGRKTMVWEIKIENESKDLISISRCTIGVVPKKDQG
ncbi:hotdog fold thioesterase [Halobacillus yeomjeoni]|uniref:Hotdog fold thioesterase n=1 Tax=Halobacillus yeomjeoni TaxID=311194 RepID=A0A931MVW3_9BACI|nr:hotdog fold thioesterase [Halobacillus yeomjeoni]MBH0231072.1 hotdog fold thioesterase [Halobacillus yeomjeoni]MCA0984483.1 hotdog fold thioesterase [Halobacillus yeomjeoni]